MRDPTRSSARRSPAAASLLILDNLEQLDGAGRWIGAFLAACPGPVVLATSRVRLRLAAEWDYPVPPLPLPDAAGPDLAVIAGADAVRLFAARAQAVLPSFAVTAENASTVAAICTRLDGLPLAIELAAARTRTLPLLLLRERLARALPLLTRGAVDAPERQQTVRDTVAWSVDLLREPEQTLFARLAVFAGGCTSVAAEAVCNPDGYEPVDVLDGIETLLDASLLALEETPAGEPRFRMLETIREFALERLVRASRQCACCSTPSAATPLPANATTRVLGGILVQDRDADIDDREGMEVVREPSEDDWGAPVRVARVQARPLERDRRLGRAADARDRDRPDEPCRRRPDRPREGRRPRT